MLTLASSPLLCGFAPGTPSATVHLRAPARPFAVRSATILQSATQGAAMWEALDTSLSRADTVETLNSLKEEGSAKLWNQFKLAPRAVSLRELTQTTKLSEKVLDPTATEYSLEDIQDTFIKVVVGATVLAGSWAAFAPFDDTVRFTGTYLIAGVPIAILAIGSVAPGILFLPIEWFKALTDDSAKQESLERVCRHEASHLLTAYCLGIPISEIEATNGKPQVVIFDEQAVLQPGTFVDAEKTLPRLAVVALSGLMAEAEAFGKALGASADLTVLNGMLLRATPPLSPQAQQDTTRYSALMAWTIVKKYEAAYEAITAALLEGKGLAACLRAAEEAEANK